MKYRKKPVVIEAIQFTGNNCFEVLHFMKRSSDIWEAELQQTDCPVIHTLEGNMHTSVGDYIIKGVKGEFYPCKPDIFEMTYEPVESIQDRQHVESSECWCGPTLIQAIDNEHNCEVWSHKGHEELNQ